MVVLYAMSGVVIVALTALALAVLAAERAVLEDAERRRDTDEDRVG